MEVGARPATMGDIGVIVELYRSLESEMANLTGMWPRADGLAEPITEAVAALIDDPHSWVYVGEIDARPVGFLMARSSALLPQAGDERLASVQLVFTEREAWRAGVGAAMMSLFLDTAASSGHLRLDGQVPPGHRAAKSFFESCGFTARRITLHRSMGPGPPRSGGVS